MRTVNFFTITRKILIALVFPPAFAIFIVLGELSGDKHD